MRCPFRSSSLSQGSLPSNCDSITPSYTFNASVTALQDFVSTKISQAFWTLGMAPGLLIAWTYNWTSAARPKERTTRNYVIINYLFLVWYLIPKSNIRTTVLCLIIIRLEKSHTVKQKIYMAQVFWDQRVYVLCFTPELYLTKPFPKRRNTFFICNLKQLGYWKFIYSARKGFKYAALEWITLSFYLRETVEWVTGTDHVHNFPRHGLWGYTLFSTADRRSLLVCHIIFLDFSNDKTPKTSKIFGKLRRRSLTREK